MELRRMFGSKKEEAAGQQEVGGNCIMWSIITDTLVQV
jgi:hypothetical protein